MRGFVKKQTKNPKTGQVNHPFLIYKHLLWGFLGGGYFSGFCGFVHLFFSSFWTDPRKSVTVQDQYHQKNSYSTCNTETGNNHTTRLVFAVQQTSSWWFLEYLDGHLISFHFLLPLNWNKVWFCSQNADKFSSADEKKAHCAGFNC